MSTSELTHDAGADAALVWALHYAEHGWSVVPVHSMSRGECTCGRGHCPSPAKHPRVRWEPAMAQPATTEQLTAWWSAWPDANIGVVTGAVSGVAVLDVDPRNGGEATLRQLENDDDVLPMAPEVRTGGGGRHLWFRVDEPVPSTELGPGLELKADGGIVVAPPSVHASGRKYVWRAGGRPCELAPPLLPWATDLEARDDRQKGSVDEQPVRTLGEQADFAEAWGDAGIELQPGDRYYLCPFHDDHHPSLHVDAEGCRWYCFGCETGGGVGRLRRLLGDRRGSPVRSRLTSFYVREPPITLPGDREVEAVGESEYQQALLTITGGTRRFGGVDVEVVAELVPDLFNRYDPDAVAIRIFDQTVGYVGRQDLAWIRPLMDAVSGDDGHATCRALIRGGWDRGRGDVGRFGVVLLLPDDTD